jgi:hypothetical protein
VTVISINRGCSLSAKIRIAAARGQYGHCRTPRHFFMGQAWSRYEWSGCRDLFTYDVWKRADLLLQRYQRICRYYDALKPTWRERRAA